MTNHGSRQPMTADRSSGGGQMGVTPLYAATVRYPRGRRLLAGAIVASLFLAACGDDDAEESTSASENTSNEGTSASENSADPYRIGISFEATGPVAEQAEGYITGLEANLQAVNDAGGIGGREIELEVMDHELNPDRAVANATRLAEDPEILAMAGFMFGNLCVAAHHIAMEEQIPMLCVGAEPDVVIPPRPNIFGSKMPSGLQAGVALAFGETLAADRDDFRIAHIGATSGSATAYGDRVVAGAQEKGWDVVADMRVAVDAADVSAQVSTVLEGNPDLITGAMVDAGLVLFMRQMQAQGANVPVINFESGSSIDSLETLAADGLYTIRQFPYPASNPDAPGMQSFIDDVRAAGGDEEMAFADYGYMTGWILTEALNECGASCSRESLADALEQLQFSTEGFTAGPVSFSPDQHIPDNTANVYQWDDSSGAPELVAERLPGSVE